MELNLPEVHAQVTAAFERYERALNANEIAVLDETFWASPHTVRYRLAGNLYGRDEILAFRKARLVRQSQAWARSEHGWRGVSAHVSWFDGPA